MRRYIVKSILITVLFVSATVYGSNEVSLFYKESSRPQNIYSHYLENNSVIVQVNQASESKEKVFKEDFFKELEIRKEVTVLPSSKMLDKDVQYLVSRETANVVWEESNLDKEEEYSLSTRDIKFDSLGQHQDRINLSELSYVSIPVVFPKNPVKVGQSWSNGQEIQIEDDVYVDLIVNYKLEKVFNLSGKHVAEIVYNVKSELKGSEVTDDPAVLLKIERLRSNGIDKVFISGEGKMGFDLMNHQPLTHVFSLVVEIAKRYVVGTQREVREHVKEIHKAEVALTL